MIYSTIKKKMALLTGAILSMVMVFGQDIESSSNHICPGFDYGSIDLIIDPSLLDDYPLPYEVEWENVDNGDYAIFTVNALTHSIENLGSGDYEIIIYLNDECSITLTEEVLDLYCGIYGEVRDATCERLGRIEVEIECDEGGHYPFSFQWQDGSTSKSRTGLSPGEYCLNAVDAYGCEYNKCWTVEGNDVLQVEVVDKDNVGLCFEREEYCDGSVDIEIVKGTPPYQYIWSNGATTQDVTELCTGTYTLTVTDNNGCTEEVTITICCCEEEVEYQDDYIQISGDCYSQPGLEDPKPLRIEGAVQGIPNPYIITTVSGGTGDYSCAWSKQGDPSFSAYTCWGISNLDINGTGTYCLTVDDGCSEETECFEIVDCEEIEIEVTGSTTVACQNYNVGTIDISVSGGSGSYTFMWNNGSTSEDLKDLPKGTYSVTVRDANYGCEQEASFSVQFAQTVRTDCIVKCGDEEVENYGPPEVVTDPNNCENTQLVCPGDNTVLKTTNVGTVLSLNVASCILSTNNAVTGDICPGTEVFGNQCRSCVFQAVGTIGETTLLINCNVDYCYFPQVGPFGASVVHNIENMQGTVATIDIGESGNCIFQVSDICTNPNNLLVDVIAPCRPSLFQQRSCFDFIPMFALLEGDPFGCFGGIQPPSNEITSSYQPILPVDQEVQKISLPERRIDISSINKKDIVVDYSNVCSEIMLAFMFDVNDNVDIVIRDNNNNRVLTMPYSAINGTNKITIKREIYSKINDGEYDINIEYKGTKKLSHPITVNCKSPSQLPNNKIINDINIYPNPFSGELNLKYFSENDDAVRVEVVSMLGDIVYRGSFESLHGENHVRIALDDAVGGSYIVRVLNNDESVIFIDKFVKIK